MAKIKFEDGTVVNFNGDPTENDVNEIASKLNLGKTGVEPQGVGGIGGSLVGAAKGLARTATGIGQLVLKGAEKIAPESIKPALRGGIQMGEELKKDQLAAKGLAEKIGMGVEQVGEWFIPAGAFTKLAKGAEMAIGASKLAQVAPKLAEVAQLGTRASIAGTEAGSIQAAQTGGEDVGSATLLGAALPIVGKGLSVIPKAIGKTREIATGVSSDVFNRVKGNTEAYQQAFKHLEDNPTQPFYAIGESIANRLKKGLDDANKKFAAAVDDVSANLGDARLDLSKNYQIMKDKVKQFRLQLPEFEAGKKGVMTEPGIVFTQTTPIPKHQVDIINDLLKTVRTAKNVSLDDARNILEKFNSAYDMIPLGGGNKPTKFHAIVTGLKKSYEDILSQAVPELKDINRQYSLIRRVYNKYAPKLIDKDTGQFKQGAETYLSNLLNMNKGAEQKNIRALEELTGIPILDNIQALKDAQKLSNLFPATGSRTQDILRSLGISGIAGAATGGVGAAASLAFSSPKVQAKAAMLIADIEKKYGKLPKEVQNLIDFISGKTLKGADVENQRFIPGIPAKKVIDKTKNLPAGMSIKDVSGGNFKLSEGLSEQGRKIEKLAYEKIKREEQKILDDYQNQFGKVINTDNFRRFFKKEGYKGYNAADVQEPSSYLKDKAFTRNLQNNKGDLVTLFAGGSGTGKTSAIKNIHESTDTIKKSAVVLDGNLSTLSSAEKKIKESIAAGKKVVIPYVYRDPVESFVQGVVKRMKTNVEEGGRLVPTKVVAENHIGSWDVVKKLYNLGVRIIPIDNSLGAGNATRTTIVDLMKKIQYPTKEELTAILNKEVKKLYESGEITKKQYEGYIE